MRVPAQAWTALAIVAGGLVVLYAAKRALSGAGSAVANAYSPGGVAYETGNTIQDAIVPGTDSLGTWLYGLFHSDYDPNAGTSTADGSADVSAYNGYPGGAGYPARTGAQVGYNNDPWLPPYLRTFGQ